MPRGKKKFALIWWVESGEKDVVSLSMIPKKHQHVDSVFNLKWRNYQTKVDTNAEAKLLAISEDENQLHRTVVTDTGTLHDPSQKIFTKEVQVEQKTINNNKKMTNDIKRSSKKKIEEKIGQAPPIFPTGDGAVGKAVQKTNTEISSALDHSQLPPPAYSSYEANLSDFSHNNAASARTPYSSTSTFPSMSNPSPNLYAQISPLKPVPPQYSDTIAPGSTSLLDLSKQNYPSAPSSTSYPKKTPNSLEQSNDFTPPSYPSTSKLSTSYSESVSVLSQCWNSSTYSDQENPLPRPPCPSNSIQSDDFSHQNHFNPPLFVPSHAAEAAAFEDPISHSASPIGPTSTREASILPQGSGGQTAAVGLMSHTSLTIPTSLNESFRSPPREIQQAAPGEVTAPRSPNSIHESNSEMSEETITSDAGPVFYGIELGTVTKQDILRQEQMLQAMKRAYESQQKMKIDSVEKFTVPDCYFEPGDKKIEISPNRGIYLSISRHKYIHDNAVLNNDWKIIVRETLLEIYGQSIVNYSATGKRTNRPGIDYRLFYGLHEWINTSSLGPVSKADLIDYINKIAANKRKYQTDLSKKALKKKTNNSDHSS